MQSAVTHNARLAPNTQIAGPGLTANDLQSLKQKKPNNNKLDKPKAYLNYVFFDKQFNFVDDGSGVKQVNGEPGELETLSSGKVVAKENGYVYVFTSNESEQDVLFDNFGVMDITGPVLEETHYYPFGLTMAGISTVAPLKLEGRRKFNGIEFNHKEFSDGSGLDIYGAKFRGLDPQIGRWWQIDPKPTDMFSPYATMEDNPILRSDLLGDTAIVNWHTGFLGLGKRHEARYIGGQWIDSKSRNALNLNSVKRKGVRRIMNEYNTLNGVKDYNPVTTAVNNATNNVNLSWSGNSQTDAPKYFSDLMNGVAHPDINVTAGGTENLPKQLFEKGTTTPSYIILGHELGHAYDLLNSGGSLSNFTQIPGLAPGISRSEVNAMYWENVLRKNANIPLRLWYNYDNSTTPQYQLRANVNYIPINYLGIITVISDLNNVHNQIRW